MSTCDAGRKPAVLIVDDESALRGVLAMALKLWGIEVIEASSGAEAVEVYRRCQTHIFLILMDVNMPGPSGPDTLEVLQEINPSVRCCFMTGHLGAYDGEELRRRGAVSVIDKPFDLDDLARLVRSQHIAA